jgi:hypothetical protein
MTGVPRYEDRDTFGPDDSDGSFQFDASVRYPSRDVAEDARTTAAVTTSTAASA